MGVLTLKHVGWFLSGLAAGQWILFNDYVLRNLMGMSHGEPLPFVAILLLVIAGAVPGLALQGRGQRAKKVFAIAVLAPATVCMLALSFIAPERLIEIYVHWFFWIFILSGLVTMALFMLLLGRRAGWRFRLAGILLSLFSFGWIPEESLPAISIYLFIVIFPYLIADLVLSFMRRPEQGTFHSYVREYRIRLPLLLHVLVSAVRFSGGVILAFCILFSGLGWPLVLLLTGLGVLAGSIVGLYMRPIPYRMTSVMVPALPLGLSLVGPGLFSPEQDLWRSQVLIFLVFFLLSLTDRILLRYTHTKLRYFTFGFFVVILSAPVLTWAAADYTGTLWMLLVLISFWGIAFVFRDMGRMTLVAVGSVLLIVLHSVFEVKFRPFDVADDLSYDSCYLPNLETAARKWETPNPIFHYYKSAKLETPNPVVRKSLFAGRLAESDSGWLESIAKNDVISGRKGAWYARLLLGAEMPVVLISKTPLFIDEDEDSGFDKQSGVKEPKQKVSHLRFFECHYYTNHRARSVFNRYWLSMQEVFAGKSAKVLRSASFQEEVLNRPFAPAAQGAAGGPAGEMAGQAPGNQPAQDGQPLLEEIIGPFHYQNLLRVQLLDRFRYLHKRNAWAQLEKPVERSVHVLAGTPGYLAFLERYYTDTQKEQKLTGILETLYGQNKGPKESLALRLAGIYTRRRQTAAAVGMASQIPFESERYRKAQLLIFENMINKDNMQEALGVLNKLLVKYPDDKGILYKKEKLLERMMIRRELMNRNLLQQHEAERNY